MEITHYSFDNPEKRFYTQDHLERVAQMAAEEAVRRVLQSPMNLENQTVKEICSLEIREGEKNMSSAFRETYSYTDEQGNIRSVRINGKNKKDTDMKFQVFLNESKKNITALTLKEYIDTTYRKSFINGLADTTKSNYERYLRLYILPFMGNIPMNKITLATIQDFYDWLANAQSHGAKKDINKKSIDRIGGFLSRILIVAEEMKVIAESPFKTKLLRNNGKPSSHHKALPDQEVDRVKREVPLLSDDRKRIYMGFLIYTGLRREEILGLRWTHINLSESYGVVETVVVYPDNKKAVIKTTPKTEHSKRSFIIPQPLLHMLKQIKNKQGFIIHGKDCEKPISLSTFQRMYRETFKTLGIKGFDNHDWRTTFCTQLKEAGMTSAQVADVMGHADTRMVETVYARTRHEGIMKHKKTVEILNSAYVAGTSLAHSTTV